MTDKLNDIYQIVGRLEGKVDGINQRLDVSNGRIGKSEERIDCLEKSVDEAKGGVKMVVVFWGIVITLVNFAISWFK
jgi:t-SNARE complex subunit (syntaxin)